MKFKKEFLIDLSWEDHDDDVEIVKNEQIDTSRWESIHRMIFKFDNKFYATTYSRGLTEQQESSPYEYDDDEIECKEVFPVEKTVIVYE